MNNSELLQPLEALLLRAQALRDLASAEQWDELALAVLDYEQAAGILGDQSYLAELVQAPVADTATALIADILALNNDLDTYTSVQREKVASELRQLSQSDKALNAYGR